MGGSENSVAGWLAEKGTCFYLLMMLAVFPVFYTNKLFSLVPDKTNFFLFITFLYICTIIPAIIKAICGWWQGGHVLKLKNIDTIVGIILLTAVIASTVFAMDSRSSFFKTERRAVSGLCFLCCIMVYFAVKQYGKYDGLLLWGWLAGSSVIYVFGILCACGINFMHIQDGISAESILIFLTPLGNAGINASYVCLVLPPIAVMYMISRERLSRSMHGINLYLGFLFTFFIKTDSSVIAIGAGIIILSYFALEHREWFERYIQMTGIYLGSKATICILLYLFSDMLHPFDGMGQLLLKGRWMVCEITGYLCICVIWRWKKDGLRRVLLAVRKYFLAAGIISALCCGICIIYVNIKSQNIPDDSFLNCLIVTDETFHRRGMIWKRTLRMLKNEGIIHKVFGNGSNSFAKVMADESISYVTGKVYYDPHNEILQIASDMGLLGLAGYFGLMISTFIKALQSWRESELQIAVILALCVYFLQSLVNGYSIFCLPLLFIFLGLANGSIAGNYKYDSDK